MKKFIEITSGNKFPIAEPRNQNGLKRDIVDLVLNMPTPDDDCMLSDFLHALQFVLDKHNVSKVITDEDINKACTRILGYPDERFDKGANWMHEEIHSSGGISEDDFRSFLRTEHLTSKWEKFLKINK